jgi:Zn-finger nucleic acid-binding protein
VVEVRAARDLDAALGCPACARRTQPLAFGGVELDGCLGCGGVWFDDGELGELARDLTEEDVARDALQAARALAADAPEGWKPHAYLPCPVCQEVMTRRNYQDVSGVILQRCDGHGAWLDRDAVLRFFGLVSSGAMKEIDSRALALRVQQQRRQLDEVEDEGRAMLRQGEIEDERRDRGIVSDVGNTIRLLLGLFS